MLLLSYFDFGFESQLGERNLGSTRLIALLLLCFCKPKTGPCTRLVTWPTVETIGFSYLYTSSSFSSAVVRPQEATLIYFYMFSK